MLISKEAQGYNKQEALETTGLDVNLDKFKNATIAWKKAGSPMNQKEINNFMEAYIKKNKCVGAYLVIDPANSDTRLRPYNVVNEVTKGKRKYTTVYQVKEADLKVVNHVEIDEDGVEYNVPEVTVVGTGLVEARADKKDVAVKLMKELIVENKKDYTIELVKETTPEQKFAAHGIYTPSKSAKLGKFLFFVNE